MKKFEFYHPILTNQYSLDWLTKTKVKDIFALRSRPQLHNKSTARPIRNSPTRLPTLTK